MRSATTYTLNFKILAKLVILSLCCIFLAACGLFGKKDKPPQYYSAVESATLQIPEGLDNPAAQGALVIGIDEAPLPHRELNSVPPRVASQATGKENSRVGWSAEGVYLWVKDSPQSVYRRLAFVIERSGMSMVNSDTEQDFRFSYKHEPKKPKEGFFRKLAFWRDGPPNYSGAYRAMIQSDGEHARIYLKNSDGSECDPDAAEHVLVILGERFG